MSGVSRVILKDFWPFVEYRPSVNKYFVVYPDINVELVMAFDYPESAVELALHTYAGTPFFTEIPVVPRGTLYPRPWLLYPPVLPLNVIVIRQE